MGMDLGIGLGLMAVQRRRRRFTPLTLFSSGEQGIWLDPSDLSTLYQDSAGTTPVTAAGQPVGRILDKSGNGYHASQPVASARPTLGRHPVGGRRNLLTYTEQFNNEAWTKVSLLAFGSGSTADATVAPDGTMTADLVVPNTNGGGHRLQQTVTIPTTGTFSVCAKAAGYNWILVQVANASNGCGYWFNVSSGVVGSASAYGTGFAASSPSITSLGDGFFRCTFSYTSNGTGNRALVSSTTADNVSSYAGDGTSGSYLWGAQLETGSTATAYQRVTSAYDVTEVGKADCWYLETDGVDDFLVTPTITPGTDKAQVFAGVRAIGTATGIVVENGDASTTNGTFALASPNAYLNLTHWSEMRGSTRLFSDTGTFPTIGPPRTDVVSFLYDIGGATPAAEMLPRLNGESKTLNVPAPPDNSAGTGNFLAYPLYIGGRGGTIYFFKGNLYGLAVRFGPNLDEATITKTEAWLNTKTGAY